MTRTTIVYTALALLAFGISMRLLPHLPNATPLVAIAFVASRYIGKRWSLILPLGALFLSDALIGFYDWRIMASVYGSFALIGGISWMSKKWNNILPIFLTVAGSAILFFLITNGAVWLFSPWYEKSFAGLLYAYELGIPFLRNMVLGDVLYTTALFGVFEFMRMKIRIRSDSFKTARSFC